MERKSKSKSALHRLRRIDRAGSDCSVDGSTGSSFGDGARAALYGTGCEEAPDTSAAAVPTSEELGQRRPKPACVLDTLVNTFPDTFAAGCAQRCQKHAGVIHGRRHVGGSVAHTSRQCGLTRWASLARPVPLDSHFHASSCRNIHKALALKQKSAQTCRCSFHTCLKTCALNLCTCFERQVVDTFVDMFVDTFCRHVSILVLSHS